MPEQIENRIIIGKKPKRLLHNLQGKKFHKLTVIEYYGISDKKQIYWRCICDCGNEILVKTADLNNGAMKSCGCWRREVGHNNFKYGCKTNRIYHIWRGMKARCFNKNNPNYPRYGGRGIIVCDEWKDNFDSFRLWAVTNGYSDELSIDRIDFDGNYCPENCRWATTTEQNNNKSNNAYFTENGKTQTLAEWCKEFNADRDRVKYYMKKHPFIEALKRGIVHE